jgi:Flp pilus assembly protein CpaB
VTAGSDVAIFITRGNATNVLIPRVRVLAVGSSTINGSAGNSEAVPSSIFTLALNQSDAEKVILGQGNGSLSFALLSKDSRTGRNGRTTTSDLR